MPPAVRCCLSLSISTRSYQRCVFFMEGRIFPRSIFQNVLTSTVSKLFIDSIGFEVVDTIIESTRGEL